MESSEKKEPQSNSFFHYTLAPISLMIWSTNFAMSVVYLVTVEKSYWHVATKHGVLSFLYESWKNSMIFDTEVVLLIAGMWAWSTISLIALGGESYFGPRTTTGHRPQYVKSGFKYYIATMLLLGVLLSQISAWYWYQKFHIIISHLIIFGYIVSLLLYIKGRICPSPGEYGSSGNIIFDYYWGLELYPRLGQNFDVKQWTNSRFGMMIMQITVLLCWKAQIEHSGWNWAMATTSIIQTLYLAKFYWWEDGYMNTIDINTDRAGYYLCWSCIAFVPAIYTLTSLYMVENSPELNAVYAYLLIMLGISFIGLTYWADYQKQLVIATDGKCKIWGKPANVIRTVYQDSTGNTVHGVLLASGFWGTARHTNYLFEISLHLCWALPSLFFSLLPYFHFLFVTILVIHRIYRDQEKCQKKYGVYWERYCEICPYKMIPGIF